MKSESESESGQCSHFHFHSSLSLLSLVSLLTTGCQQFPRDSYPVGIYSVPTTNDLAEVRQAGFNTVAGRLDRPYLDTARALDVRVLASPGTAAGPRFNAGAARRAVEQFDSHPALWAWYLVDEPDLNIVPPHQVKAAHRFLKSIGARKPTALVLFKGSESWNYGKIADITMIDRYPIPWLPLANFAQHVRLARLGAGAKRPLIAVIQAFDWSYYRELVPREKNLRPPTYEELRCMTYCALVNGANGIFYYAYNSSRWKMAEHPDVWQALKRVVAEIREREPLFQAEHRWWIPRHDFRDWDKRFNAALESAVAHALLRVANGNTAVPPGDYILTVNTTEHNHLYSFQVPYPMAGPVPVLGENRTVTPQDNRVSDEFGPYAVHVYGPLR